MRKIDPEFKRLFGEFTDEQMKDYVDRVIREEFAGVTFIDLIKESYRDLKAIMIDIVSRLRFRLLGY